MAVEPIRIEGLKEFQAALRKMDGQSQKKLRLVFNEAADTVAEGAKSLVPKRSGAAAGSIKVQSSQREARVKAGGKAPYYPWLDFGGAVGINNSVRRPFIKEGRYIYPTYKAKKSEFQRQLEDGLKALVRESGLEVS